MKTPKEIDLIIFDLDGTLIDSKRDIVNSMNSTLKGLCLKAKPDETIANFIGYGVRGFIRDSLGSENQGLFKKALKMYEKEYSVHMLDTSRLFPGVLGVLEYLEGKLKVIITNKRKRFAKAQLEYFGIAGYFGEIMGGDDETCLKPSPCQPEAILKKYRISSRRAILVGDMAFDVESGKQSGILTCGVTYGIGSKEAILKAKPDFVITNIIQLKRIIR
jgi:phosphoglycolate phosphatase-like HAD superfamily hydrolase